MKRSTQRAFAIGIISLVALGMPAAASAQALSKTVQVLPPGGTGCPQIPVTAIVAHTNEGALHSFDVTVQDPAYVAVLAQVGTQAVPFRYMTRFNHGGGFVRHHVDMDSTRIGNALAVSLTLLSSPVGSPTCLSVISFSVSPNGQILAPGATSTVTPAPSNTGGTKVPGKVIVTPGKSPVATGTATTTEPSPVAGGVVTRFKALCEGNGGLQLWFLLLAVYIVIAALTALSKPPLAEKSVGLPLTLILVPLVLLMGFWLLAPSCRAAGWIPAVAILTAGAALLVAFREQHPGLKIISLPAAKPSANTPMVSKSTSPVPVETKRNQVKGQ